jgi:prepilin-type N-terminal cleavage/methylation domain-containing protein
MTIKKEGFTLIELLVVITIIGLLSSIVLVNVWSQRNMARDAKIKEQLHQVRNAAEFVNGYINVCDGDDTLSDQGDLGNLEKAIMGTNGDQAVKCFVSVEGNNFAVSSPLIFKKGKYACTQAAGATIEIDNQINSASCQ